MVNYETFYLSWRTWDLERDDFFVLKAVDIILSHVYCVRVLARRVRTQKKTMTKVEYSSTKRFIPAGRRERTTTKGRRDERPPKERLRTSSKRRKGNEIRARVTLIRVRAPTPSLGLGLVCARVRTPPPHRCIFRRPKSRKWGNPVRKAGGALRVSSKQIYGVVPNVPRALLRRRSFR